MMLILNYNSWHSKLYRWFYNRNQLPNNLCPYFSKLTLALIFSPILFILRLANPIKKLTFKHEAEIMGLEFNVFIYFFVFLIELFIWTTVLMIRYGFHYMNKFHNTVTSIWWAILFLTAIVGVAMFIAYSTISIVEKVKNSTAAGKDKREKRWVVIECIKAWYRRNCPLIKWEKQNL